ncbi:GRIP and coiled-coil domain-containing protein [Halyomorpha halys]|uniref:GRIP and coiled-coil domain-containing protein n=1 Tax=Halyomorpha halys TaxID=286706 RepID=UPI0006D4C861|nr:uncharacterized protein LOC106689854 [Halyomorpha halys]
MKEESKQPLIMNETDSKESLNNKEVDEQTNTIAIEGQKENCSSNNKLGNLMKDIKGNLALLDDSIKLSHYTERMIFQNELQLLIDSHLLDFELDREKFKNARLKRMNEGNRTFNIIPRSENDEVKYLRKKCQNLTSIMRKRSLHINKALAQIRDLKNDKENLKQQLKDKDLKIKEMFDNYSKELSEMDNKVKKIKEEADKEKKKYVQNNLQIALQEQIKQNKQLVYNNCQLKTQIAQSKTLDKFNISTQVSEIDISRNMYHGDVSG